MYLGSGFWWVREPSRTHGRQSGVQPVSHTPLTIGKPASTCSKGRENLPFVEVYLMDAFLKGGACAIPVSLVFAYGGSGQKSHALSRKQGC